METVCVARRPDRFLEAADQRCADASPHVPAATAIDKRRKSSSSPSPATVPIQFSSKWKMERRERNHSRGRQATSAPQSRPTTAKKSESAMEHRRRRSAQDKTVDLTAGVGMQQKNRPIDELFIKSGDQGRRKSSQQTPDVSNCDLWIAAIQSRSSRRHERTIGPGASATPTTVLLGRPAELPRTPSAKTSGIRREPGRMRIPPIVALERIAVKAKKSAPWFRVATSMVVPCSCLLLAFHLNSACGK